MAVIGTHARDTPIGGYSDVPKHVVSVLEGMQEAGKGRFAVDYAEGVRITESRCWSCDEVKLVPAAVNRKLIAEAVQTARKADVIVMVLGDNEQTSREAGPTTTSATARRSTWSASRRSWPARSWRCTSRPSWCCSTAGRCR